MSGQSKPQLTRIARLLCRATDNVLLDRNKAWLAHRHPGVSLGLQIGNGKQTCHRRIAPKEHRITYGLMMIESKLQSKFECGAWTTGREVLERNYFGGQLSIQHALAATVCHEYAHFIQVLGEHRSYRSVHNAKFYEILDRMHHSGAAGDVLNFLLNHEDFRQLAYISYQEGPRYGRADIRAGMSITFQEQGDSPMQAKVVKVNKKTVSATVGLSRYRIPYHLITNLNP